MYIECLLALFYFVYGCLYDICCDARDGDGVEDAESGYCSDGTKTLFDTRRSARSHIPDLVRAAEERYCHGGRLGTIYEGREVMVHRRCTIHV